MKKILLTLTACLSVVSLRADVVFNETFNYVDGPSHLISTNVPGVTNWFRHSGTSSDSLIRSKNIQVGNGRQDDVNRPFYTGGSGGYTNSVTNIFNSFTVNCTNVPLTTNYFGHYFRDSSTFHGKVWFAPGTLPNTWRLGVTTASSAIGQVKFFPLDLATNTDYQVVLNYDETQGPNSIATLWVNPISSGDPSVVALDATAGTLMVAYAFRQTGSGGGFNNLNISNLVVATSFAEAATNVWNTNAVAPVMAYSPKSATNFVGQPATLFGVAAGQGLSAFTFTWLKDGAIFDDPGSFPDINVITFPFAQASDSGAYRLVATTPYGLSVTSSVANLWVTNAPVPPTFTTQPSNTTVFFGQTATLRALATGPGTFLNYQWKYLGTDIPGETNPSLQIPNVQTNNGTTGAYSVGVTNDFGGIVSSNAVLSAIPIPTVSVAYLRTLVDPVTYLATNSTAVFKVTGIVTTLTNLTTGDTSSYYLQDGTAGINIFATFASTFRPAQGDVLTFVGVLSSFGSTLELLANQQANPVASYTVLSNNIAALPAPKVIPFNFTNNTAQVEATEGTAVMLTNVFFASPGSLILTTANTTAVVSNSFGETFTLLFSSQNQDTGGQTLPAFAHTVRGVLTQDLPNGTVPPNQAYRVTVTRFSDIVTDAPPAVTASIAVSGTNKTTVSWEAVPYAYSYSLQSSADVAGPYVSEQRFEAALRGVNENPINTSTATGFGTVALSPDQTSIRVNLSFSGLTAPANQAHIHGPAGPGTNAGVIFPFSGVPAATSGSIPEQVFTINATQVGYLTNGLLYMNVHNASPYPGGEIRAQILPVRPVGLTFTTTNGTYTDINAAGGQKFYRLVSP